MILLQLYEEVPYTCQNEECENYGVFELIDVEEIKDDEKGGYIICPDCGEKVYID